jgi:hypothetical protein
MTSTTKKLMLETLGFVLKVDIPEYRGAFFLIFNDCSLSEYEVFYKSPHWQ